MTFGSYGDLNFSPRSYSSMNVLFLCKRYYTNKDLIRDRFGRLYHLPVALAKNGATVHVLAFDYRGSKHESISIEGVEFKSIPLTLISVLKLLLDVYRGTKDFKPDIIIASGDSYIGYLGKLISTFAGARFVFDVYDYYPAFPGNRIPGMKRMFKKALTSADVVLSASRSLADKLSSTNPSTIVVNNGVDETLFRPYSKMAAREELDIPLKSKVVGYFGSIVPSRGPILIDACRQIVRDYENFILLLAGPVAGVSLDDPWIHYLGPQAQCSIPKLIAACDIVAIPYAADTFNEFCGACKIPEYLACGRPVVATKISDHQEYFKAAPNSLCEPDAGAMADAIRKQFSLNQAVDFPDQLKWSCIGESLYKTLAGVCRL